MQGHISGVATQIQNTEPSAIRVHCLAHCTNLCLQTMGRKVNVIRDALDLVMEVSQLIRYSPKRSHLFKSLQSQLSPSAPGLKPLCPTRWTVRTGAIDSIIVNYGVLCDCLTEVNAEGRDEYAIRAGGILHLMEKFSTYYGLKLSHLIFSGAEQLSRVLQGEDTNIQEAIQASKLTLNYFNRLRSDEAFASFYKRVCEESAQHTANPTLPRYATRPRRLDNGESSHRFQTPETYFRQMYFEALDTVRGELEQRFQQRNGIPVAAALEKILLDGINGSLADLPEELDNYYSKDIDLFHLKQS